MANSIRPLLNMVKEIKSIYQVRGKELNATSLADLYAGVERDRISVGEIFVSPDVEEELKEQLGDNLRRPGPFMAETDEIRYIGSAWGADYYVTDKIPKRNIIAVTVPGLLPEALRKGRGVAKLVLSQSDKHRWDHIEIETQRGEDEN